MGYSHYWYRPQKMNAAQFEKYAEDCRKISSYCQNSLGIALADGHGKNEPVISKDEIWFNGSDSQPLGVWTTDEEVSIPWPSTVASLTDPIADPIAQKTAGTWFAGTIVSQRVAPISKANGMGSGSYETFYIPRESEREENEIYNGVRLHFDYIKTAYRPYDLPVTACLIALKHYFPECLIHSDGEDKDWIDGKILCNNLLGYGMEFQIDTAHPIDYCKTEEFRQAQAVEIVKKRAAFPSTFPHLIQAQNSPTLSHHALAAGNIRKELGIAFPGVRFSVRSRSYSGGDSVDVSWTDGPTTKEVEAIADKYQEGNFDGMTDCYNFDKDDSFTCTFGGAKYVQEQRGISQDRYIEVAQSLGINTLTFGDHWQYNGVTYEQWNQIQQEAYSRSYFKQKKAA